MPQKPNKNKLALNFSPNHTPPNFGTPFNNDLTSLNWKGAWRSYLFLGNQCLKVSPLVREGCGLLAFSSIDKRFLDDNSDTGKKWMVVPWGLLHWELLGVPSSDLKPRFSNFSPFMAIKMRNVHTLRKTHLCQAQRLSRRTDQLGWVLGQKLKWIKQ